MLIVEGKKFSGGKGGQRVKPIIHLLCRDFEFVMPYSQIFLHRNVMAL
jgi:hypothetical protein